MTEHMHEIEIKNKFHLTTRWMVRDGSITDQRGHHSYFDYTIEDAKELRDWLTARIDEIEGESIICESCNLKIDIDDIAVQVEDARICKRCYKLLLADEILNSQSINKESRQ